jgi:hypothetical protein
MSQLDNTTSHVKAGDTIVKETKRGIEFHAFNWTRQRMLHIGTLKGQTYEKQAEILRQPEPSFCLTQSEFGAVVDCGAGFIRIIPQDKTGTYSISVSDFRRHAEAYYNGAYGPQWRCALIHFQRTSKVAKRNAHTDNPVIEVAAPLIRDRQMSLFG